MPYRGGSLADIAPEEPLLAAGRRTAERVGDLLLDRVKSYTPVAESPFGGGEWLTARGRAPGTLRASWERSGVVHATQAGRFGVDVLTHDPVAPDVEYPTRPHLIQARRGRALRWWDEFGIRFADHVLHPGTQGSFMLHRAIADVDVEWQRIGLEELERWAHEVEAGL